MKISRIAVVIMLVASSSPLVGQSQIESHVAVCAEGRGQVGAALAEALRNQIRVSSKYILDDGCTLSNYQIHLSYVPVRIDDKDVGMAVSYTLVYVTMFPIIAKDKAGKPIGEFTSVQLNYLHDGLMLVRADDAQSDVALKILGRLSVAAKDFAARLSESDEHYKAY